MPAILERLVRQLKSQGYPEVSAYAIATKSLQKTGNLKPGSQKATEQGKFRGRLTPEQREQDRRRGGRLSRNMEELQAKKRRKRAR